MAHGLTELVAAVLRLVRSGRVARGEAHLNVTINLFLRRLRRAVNRGTPTGKLIDDKNYSRPRTDPKQKAPETI